MKNFPVEDLYMTLDAGQTALLLIRRILKTVGPKQSEKVKEKMRKFIRELDG